MSQLRLKADKIQAEGAEKRRDWNPSVNSSHYKVYRWWLRKSGKFRQRENFCHYWRVIVLWAPLRALAMPALVLLSLIALVGIGAFIITQFSVVIGLLVGMAGFAYCAFGIRTGGQLLKELNEQEFDDAEWTWLDTKPMALKSLMFLLASPVILGLGTLILIFGSIAVTLASLHDEQDLYRRIGRWFVYAHVGNHKLLNWLRPILALPAALALLSFWFGAALVVLIGAVVIALLIGLFLLVAYLVDASNEKRRARYRQQLREQDAREDNEFRTVIAYVIRYRLFPMQHPEWAGDDSRYEHWYKRYERHCLNVLGQQPLALRPYYHLYRVQVRYEKIYGRSIYDPLEKIDAVESVVKEVRQPNKLQRMATGIGDFFILIWSFVLAKKWKICPLVELPE